MKKERSLPTRTTFKLKQGENGIQQGNNELSITGTGRTAYIWIGGRGCYGHLSGVRTLKKLATSILRALDQETS